MAEHIVEEKKILRFVNTGFRVTHSTNEDLLNIKHKDFDKSLTWSRRINTLLRAALISSSSISLSSSSSTGSSSVSYKTCLKLHMKSVPLATACIVYHRFFKEYSLQEYDPYLIASTAIYLAGKVEESHVTIRDVVNVSYRTLHKSKLPLEMGDMFFALKDTIAKSELFLLRALQFRVVYNHPHRYLLHYLKFLKDWFEPFKWDELPLARTAWALLRDSYHGTLCLQYKPQHVAVAILYLTIESHGADIPHEDTAVTPWWKVFSEDISLEIIKQIISELLNIYDLEMTAN